MYKILKILLDYYRYKFLINNDIKAISYWKTKAYTIEERKKIIDKLDCLLINKKLVHKIEVESSTFNYLIEILKENQDENFKKLYNYFNQKKKLPKNIILNKKITTKSERICLLSYCLFSKILIEKYKLTNNIQYLNTSLKVNDFVISCMFIQKNDVFKGLISYEFPSKLKTITNCDHLNYLVLKNLNDELKILSIYEV